MLAQLNKLYSIQLEILNLEFLPYSKKAIAAYFVVQGSLKAAKISVRTANHLIYNCLRDFQI
jgi:hypothetical protein